MGVCFAHPSHILRAVEPFAASVRAGTSFRDPYRNGNQKPTQAVLCRSECHSSTRRMNGTYPSGMPFIRRFECHFYDGIGAYKNGYNDTIARLGENRVLMPKPCIFGDSALLSGVVTNHSGSALEWHSRGRGFDPPCLHQYSISLQVNNL